MYIEKINNSFKTREPILKEEIEKLLSNLKQSTINQLISYMVSFGLLKRYENGIYYIPSKSNKFFDLKPSLKDIVEKKYLLNSNGIRVGAYLLYKYKFTSQVSEYYEILTNKVSFHTRSKKLYDGKVIVSYPKFRINKDNILYHEFLELIKIIHLSDYDKKVNIKLLWVVYDYHNLENKKLNEYSKYYRGNKLAYIRKYIDEVIKYGLTQ